MYHPEKTVFMINPKRKEPQTVLAIKKRVGKLSESEVIVLTTTVSIIYRADGHLFVLAGKAYSHFTCIVLSCSRHSFLFYS